MTTLSAEQLEILGIVREHGPISLNDITPKVTMLLGRDDVARALFNLKATGYVLRTPNKCYVIGVRNDPAAILDAVMHPPINDSKTNKKAVEPIPTAPNRPPDIKPIPNAPNRAVRIEDLESKPAPITPATEHRDPLENVLTVAAKNTQANLDAFTAEVGDLAEIMAALIDSRDRANAALATYRRTKA